MTIFRCFILIALCSGFALTRDIDLKTMTVCEILPRLKSYRGKMVAVRGLLYVGEEVGVLRGVDCPRKFVTDGYTWPETIDLAGPDHPVPEGDQAVTFETEDVAKLDKIADEARAGKEVWVTLIGQLRVRRKYVPVHTNYGILWNGYGHLNANPAQLVIKGLKDVVVK